MPSRRLPHHSDALVTPYRSTACRIGTHHACAESSPALAPVDVPVIYEACDCPCHPGPHDSTPTDVEQVSGRSPGGAPAPNIEITERQTWG